MQNNNKKNKGAIISQATRGDEVEKVILVTDRDQPVGEEWKIEAHRKGLLHRAFSVFVFNKKGEMLLQRRALSKYHSPGLWTNTCCSHPRPGEETKDAALRRLLEEMGFITEINKIFDFVYKAEFDNGLTEYEFDHVFAGEYEGDINPDSQEVEEYCFQPMNEIKEAIQDNPAQFTVWFRIAFPKVEEWWLDNKKVIVE